MAERLNKCPKCSSVFTTTLKMHNPETSDMNARATLQCDDCKHQWEDKVISPFFQKQRERGWVI